MKLLPGPTTKKPTRRVKRVACQHCGEKFAYRNQLNKHINRCHKQGSGDAATSGDRPASNEGEVDCSF